jgi:Rad3-related DNA helicase
VTHDQLGQTIYIIDEKHVTGNINDNEELKRLRIKTLDMLELQAVNDEKNRVLMNEIAIDNRFQDELVVSNSRLVITNQRITKELSDSKKEKDEKDLQLSEKDDTISKLKWHRTILGTISGALLTLVISILV